MALSINAYIGDGATTDFTLSFPFLDRSHVVVLVNNIVPILDHTFLSDSIVRLATAPGSGDLVVLKRVTPLASRLVDFTDGAVLPAADLDKSALQMFYIQQELQDQFDEMVNGGLVRVSGGNQDAIDAMVTTLLGTAGATALQAAISDIDDNASSILTNDTLITNLQAEVDALSDIGGTGLSTFLLNLQTSSIDGDIALAADLALIGAANGGDTAWILNSNTVKLDTDGGDTFAVRLGALRTDIDGNSASIVTEQTARSDGDSAEATARGVLAARVTDNENDVATNAASIVTEQNVRADADSATASDIVLIGAANGGGTAFILDMNTVEVSAGNSIGSRLSGIDTAVGDNSASVVINAAAIVSTDGDVTALGAKFGVTLDVNGYITGFSQNNDGQSGTFKILADKFLVIDPQGGASQAGDLVFEIVGGTTFIKNAVIPNLSATKITTDELSANRINLDGITLTASGGQLVIKDGGVDTGQVADDAITETVDASNTSIIGFNVITWTDIETATITVPTGETWRVHSLNTFMWGRSGTINTTVSSYHYKLVRDTTDLVVRQQVFIAAYIVNDNVPIQYSETLTAGTYTYKLQGKRGTGVASSRSEAASMILLGVKK